MRSRVLIRSSVLVFVVTFLSAGISLAIAQQMATDPALRTAINARDLAVDKADAAAVGRLTSDDYSAVNPSGQLINRAQRLAGFKSQVVATTPPIRREEALRIYGASAVQRVKNGGMRQILVWTKTADGWKMTAAQNVPDQAPPPAAPNPANLLAKAEPSNWSQPAGLSAAQSAVFAVHKQLQDGFFAGDAAAIAKSTALEFMRPAPGGSIRNREESLQAMGGPRRQPTHDELSIQIWDRVGAVRWRETTAAGVTTRLLRVLVSNGSTWQQVALASTVVEQGSR